MKVITDLLRTDGVVRRGLLHVEWVVMVYTAVTLLFMLCNYTRLPAFESMLYGRMGIVGATLLLWMVYMKRPCRLTMFMRIGLQGALLAWWYPDTYEINRILPNLDHWFAMAEQAVFGFQPAMVFAPCFPSPVVSELMDMGYALYYPIIALTVVCYFLMRYDEFERCAFVLITSFMAFYLIFDFLPVAGPTFYYKAVGLEHIAQGVFPAVGDYFNHNTQCLPTPGYADGFFYGLVEGAKAAGERPTAAFPSSHVGIATVCMLLLWRLKARRLFYCIVPVYVFLCMATVYIQAHYAIDAVAGLAVGAAFYYGLQALADRLTDHSTYKKNR